MLGMVRLAVTAAAVLACLHSALTLTPITGNTHTFVDADLIGGFVTRSNSDTSSDPNMEDVFPSNLSDQEFAVYNDNANTAWIVTGTTLVDGYILLGPKQTARFRVDGGTIRPTIKPVFAPRRPLDWWVRNFTADAALGTLPASSDANHCLTRNAACATIQAAYDKIRKTFPNLQSQTIWLAWNHSGTGLGPDYIGPIAAWQIPGLPADYGLTIQGENDGAVRTRIISGLAGGIHVAGDQQVYLRWTGVWSLGGQAAVLAAYGGKVFLDHVVLYGASNSSGSVGAALLEAGPVAGSQIMILCSVHIVDGQTSTVFATSFARAIDGGKIGSQATCEDNVTPTRVYMWNNNVRFSYGTAIAANAGRIEFHHAWSDGVGYPSGPGNFPIVHGKTWDLTSGSILLRGGITVPGDIAGSSPDSIVQ